MGLKTKNGLAVASIKTFGGLARAAVKTVQGLEVSSAPPSPPALTFWGYVDAVQLFYELGMGPSDTLALASWTDRSGNAEHPAQSNALKRPVLESDGTRAVVSFNGTTQFLEVNITDRDLPTTPAHVFWACYGTPGGNQLVANFGPPYIRAVSSNDMRFDPNAAPVLDGGTWDTMGAWTAKLNSSGNTLRKNGTQTDSDTGPGTSLTTLKLGTFDGVDFMLNGKICVFAWGPEQTDPNRGLFEAYIAEAAVIP